MNKVTLKDGEVHCDRCGGEGIFYVRVHNGKGVPAAPDAGECYRCKGSGIDPYLKAPIEEKKPRYNDSQKARFLETFSQIMTLTEGHGSCGYKQIRDVNALNTLINSGYVSKYKDSGITFITPTAQGVERFELKYEEYQSDEGPEYCDEEHSDQRVTSLAQMMRMGEPEWAQ